MHDFPKWASVKTIKVVHFHSLKVTMWIEFSRWASVRIIEMHARAFE